MLKYNNRFTMSTDDVIKSINCLQWQILSRNDVKFKYYAEQLCSNFEA